MHSGDGDVREALADNRPTTVTVEKGEYVDLVFQSEPPQAGYRQVVLLASEGMYRPASQPADPPSEFSFDQNYPNPFNPATVFSFALPQACRVSLKIYNVLGQTVAVVVDSDLPAGHHTVSWDSRNQAGQMVATGIYIASFTAGTYSATKKLEVLK